MQSKNGINPLSFFDFIPNDLQKLKSRNFKLKNKNFESVDPFKDDFIIIKEGEELANEEAFNEDDDLKKIEINSSNLECFYDIDGINGFANINEIKRFKQLIDMKVLKKKKKSPLTKNKYLNDRGVMRTLKDLFAMHFGGIQLNGLGKESIDFYLIFNISIHSLKKKEENKIRELVYDEFLIEMRKTLDSQRLRHCHMTFMKSSSDFRSSFQSDVHSDILDSDCILTGKIDSEFVSNVVANINSKLGLNKKAVIFF